MDPSLTNANVDRGNFAVDENDTYTIKGTPMRNLEASEAAAITGGNYSAGTSMPYTGPGCVLPWSPSGSGGNPPPTSPFPNNHQN